MLSALGELLAAALRLLARMGSFDYATAPLREAVTALRMTTLIRIQEKVTASRDDRFKKEL